MSEPAKGPLPSEAAIQPAQIPVPDAQSDTPAPSGEKRISNELSAQSSSTVAPAAKEQQRPKTSPSNNADPVDEMDALIAHLPEEEQRVLRVQLDELKANISFFGLWRYATKIDLLIIVISAVCAIAAGAALPLFTVCINSYDRSTSSQLIVPDSLWFPGHGFPEDHVVSNLLRRFLP